MAQFEITDFPEIAALPDAENFVFYVKRVSDGQDYKIKLGNVQSLITDTVSGSGSQLIQDIVDAILPDIESEFEQLIENQVNEAIAAEETQIKIEKKITDLLGENYENPYLNIVAEVNNVLDNAATNRKFGKAIDVVQLSIQEINEGSLPNIQNQLDELNNVTLPDLDVKIENLNTSLSTLNTETLTQLRDDLDSLNETVVNLGGVDLEQLEEDLQLVESNLQTLTTVTLPAVQEELDQAKQDIINLGDFDVSAIESELENLNNTVIPNINSTLDNLNNVVLPDIEEELLQNEQILISLQEDLSNVTENNEASYIVGIVNNILDNKISSINSNKGINFNQVELKNLNENVIPSIQTTLVRVNSDLGQLNNSTIPALQSTLGQLNLNLQSVQGLFPIKNVNIDDNSISASKIQSFAVGTTQLSDGAVDVAKIADAAITSDKIRTDAVISDKIAANAIISDKIAANAITASKIEANAVTADKIEANAVTADKIEANAVTADKILANSIESDKIAANAVNADKIAANSIESDKIVSNAVTADKIAANAVTADKIEAGSISSDKIVSNAIISDLISSNTILGRHLVLSDLSNILDGSFWDDEDNIPWSGVGTSVVRSTDVSYSGTHSLKVNSTSNTVLTFNTKVSVNEGDNLHFDVWVNKNSSYSATTAQFKVVDSQGSVYTKTLSPTGQSNTWFNISDSFECPNTDYLTITLEFVDVVGSLYIDNMYLRRMNNAELIVDGAITTNKMTANSINGDRIATNTLNADKIVTGTITADKIQGNSITADQIASGTITGSLIAGTTITGNKLVANTITGDKIAVNTIYSNNIKVGDFDNIVRNPSFVNEDGAVNTDGWVNVNSTASVNNSTDWGNATRVGVGSSYVTYYEPFNVQAGEKYFASVLIADLDNNLSDDVRLGFRYTLNNGTTGHIFNDSDLTVNDVYTQGSTSIEELSTYVDVPDNCKSLSVLLRIGNTGTSSGDFVFTNVYVRRLLNGKLIVDGSITADKIVANSITSEQIAASAIGADQISAGVITADKIASNTITGDKIAANTISSKELYIANVENLVNNSTFIDSEGNPTNHSWEPVQSIVDVSGEPLFKGNKYAVRVSNASTLTSTVPFNVVDGQSYNIRAIMKPTSTPSGDLYFGLLLEKEDGTLLYKSKVAYEDSVNSGVYECSLKIDIPEDQGYVRAYPRFSNQSNVAFDISQIYTRLMNDGALIVDGTISASKIVAKSIGADQITANSIGADEIVANSIGADQIEANSIGADQIASKSIGADQIVANSITGDLIASNTIQTRSLTIADFTNLIDGSDFEDETNSNWDLNKTIFDSSTKYSGAKSLRLNPTSTGDNTVTYLNDFYVESGDKLLTTCYVRKNANLNGPVYIVFRRSDDGTLIASQELTDNISNNTWVKFVDTVTLNYTGRVTIKLETSANAGYFWFDNGVIRRKYKGELIVDGSITASKIAAEAIEAEAIKSGAISADKIASETITGDLIASNTITSKNLIISDFENIADGSTFEDPDANPWNISGQANVVIAGDDYHSGSKSLKVSGYASTRSINLDKQISLEENEELSISYYVKTDGSWNGTTGNSKFRISNESDNLLAGRPFNNSSGSWVNDKFTFVAPHTGKFIFKLVFDNTAGNIWVDDIFIRRKKNGNLIVDGTITASKIAAEAITATKLSSDAIDGKIITGTILRTSVDTSGVPRVVVGDTTYPLWYGTGSVGANNGVFYVTNNGSAYAQNMVLENQCVFKGSLNGATGTFTGTLSAGTITGSSITGGTINGTTITGTNINGNTITGGTISGATVTGGLLRTAASGYRTEIEDDTYMIWVGNGAKNDSNGIFWVKKDGTGFIKGTFFQGQIIESKLASNQTEVITQTTNVTHNSIGNDVEITLTCRSSYYDNLGEGDSYLRIYRNGTLIKTIQPEYTVSSTNGPYNFVVTVPSQTFTYIDTGTSSGDVDYTFEFVNGATAQSWNHKEFSVKTFENKLG